MGQFFALMFAGIILCPAWFGALCLTRGVRQGEWNQPAWFFILLCTGSYLCIVFWVYGASLPGLDPGEACANAGSWNEEYLRQNRREMSQIFPLSVPCSATFNLVPWWLNPLLAILTALAVIGLVGTVFTVTTRLAASTRGNPTRESPEPTPQTLEPKDR
jgi:hypothetical protein